MDTFPYYLAFLTSSSGPGSSKVSRGAGWWASDVESTDSLQAEQGQGPVAELGTLCSKRLGQGWAGSADGRLCPVVGPSACVCV